MEGRGEVLPSPLLPPPATYVFLFCFVLFCFGFLFVCFVVVLAIVPLSTPVKPVRVKGGNSLRNGMWHGARNGIIMQNTIYAGNKLTEERILFSRQFYKSSSFFDVADY